MTSSTSSYMKTSDENHPYHHDTPTSSSTSFSTSSSCSSPDVQKKEYTLLNNKSRRKKRDFIPDDKKDPTYWSQRSKNNLSAKRSRVKRRMNDLVLETKLTQLNNENQILRAKIDMLARKFGHLSNNEEDQNDAEDDSGVKFDNKEPEQTQLLNILDQSASSSINSTEKQSLIEKTSAVVPTPMPMKWRFKLFNMT
ncbi:unnamed protein product [Rotaria magnacalcarata]|uniref:BZIP domain-containing protein n=4 Tax=Rotaria magnacalcarata TaxID=392030 RepID=A0A816NWD6_9BILA|nr:unnamed protein product [Rotaria magnacalcarata]CAF1682036.1 unnamed protein product [Rotaria magnacalcarata]CAF2041247.1 unnamed protein product [Rotaria magnacalcarata]CAF2113350.1 unnamed protein product [Rotaria magnacalcarata]CAF2135451.1 unnamed protein product [Rotaria magnacalcarata]